MKMYITVKAWYNEPLYNEVLSIAINYFLTLPELVINIWQYQYRLTNLVITNIFCYIEVPLYLI